MHQPISGAMKKAALKIARRSPKIKTENRYEYRKTQEKRKQMIAPDLFEFAYVLPSEFLIELINDNL